MAVMSARVSVLVAPVPVRTPFTFRPPASTHTKFSPRVMSCSRIWLEPPSPMATVQMTAPIPMVMPSIVSAVRSRLRDSARKAMRSTAVKFIRLALAPSVSVQLCPIPCGDPSEMLSSVQRLPACGLALQPTPLGSPDYNPKRSGRRCPKGVRGSPASVKVTGRQGCVSRS